ncbi:MAG TPA: SpoIID/LytB domain-containing protein [Bacteroidales bacterium]|nr:SpoIID/LytB domain-containing protein [Bacteroidales bacterium]
MRNAVNRLLLSITLSFLLVSLSGQVSIRIFAGSRPESVIFNVSSGGYFFNSFEGDTLKLVEGDLVLIARLNGKLAVKTRHSKAFLADSIIFFSIPESSFSVRLDGANTTKQVYSGDLKIKNDLNTIVMISNCDRDSYLAGVVSAEGGSGRSREYYKTQAVIARTYMYKYNGKHLHDGYNLCDNTHCQAFNGIVADTEINNAVKATMDIVIMAQDSTLIISAFHSNCGGETASSEDVWLTGVPYLKKITDPYCRTSKNASWVKTIPLPVWIETIGKLTHGEQKLTPADAGLIQETRIPYYKAGNVNIAFSDIRNELGLRSAFFSVVPSGENIILEGRGYGHGVGLCQEGAMNMALKGFSYSDIIKFYYTDIIIGAVSASKPDAVVR